MNAYNLTMELIQVMGDIDRKIEEKGKTSMMEKWLMIDADIIRLEKRMFEIINTLKTVQVPQE